MRYREKKQKNSTKMRIISEMGNKYDVTYHVFPNPAKNVLSDSHMFQKVYSNTSLSTKIRFYTIVCTLVVFSIGASGVLYLYHMHVLF